MKVLQCIRILFCNNIFLGNDHPIAGILKGSTFLGNDWWNASGESRFMDFKNLDEWAKETGQELLNGNFAEMQEDPEFKGPMVVDITDPYQMVDLIGLTLKPDSPLKNKGLDLKSILNLMQPLRDFYGNLVPLGDAAEPGIYEMR